MKNRISSFLVLISLFSVVLAPAQASLKRSEKVALTVFAASSLGQTFSVLGKAFEAKHPGVTVQFSFLASSTLATQLLAGAPADVFASASTTDMALMKTLVPDASIFAANRVVLATALVGRFHVNKIIDLNKPGLKWIQCAHIVPCGAAADAALAYEGRVTSKPVSLEPKVSSVVAKLLSGEVDAAIIYHTDYVANKAALKEIRFKGVGASTTQYPIGVLKNSSKGLLAQSFVDSVLSANGRKVLAEAGFIRVN